MKPNTFLIVFVAIVLIALFIYADLATKLSVVLENIKELPFHQSAFIFIVLSALSTITFVPTTVFNLYAGVAYGIVTGTILTLIGLQIGAFIAFLLGRSVLRDFAQRKIDQSKQLQALSRAVSGPDGFKLVALCRLATVFPFALLNYIFAVTPIDPITYNIASLVGLAPGILLYCIAGQQAAGSSEDDSNLTGYIGAVISVAAVIGTSVYAKSIIDKEMNKTPLRS